MVEAMETYKRVLSIDRANVASMCNLAILEQRVCRNFPAAERYFMQCLECDPYHCTALANYASLKMEQRDSASAHRLYLRYPERSGRARKWGTAVSSREAFSSATVGLACLLPHIDIPRNTKRRCLAVDGQNVASLMGLALLLRVVSSPHSLLVNDFTICISIRMSWPSLYVMVLIACGLYSENVVVRCNGRIRTARLPSPTAGRPLVSTQTAYGCKTWRFDTRALPQNLPHTINLYAVSQVPCP